MPLTIEAVERLLDKKSTEADDKLEKKLNALNHGLNKTWMRNLLNLATIPMS